MTSARLEYWDGLKERLNEGKVSLQELVSLKYFLETETEEPDDVTEIELLYDRAVATFKKKTEDEFEDLDGDVALAVFSAGCGVYLTPDGTLNYTIVERAIGFDWLAAYELLNRANRIATRSLELWVADARSLSESSGPQRRKAKETIAERMPHCRRAYELCTSILSAVNMEKVRREELVAAGEKLSREPSQEFLKRVDVIEPSIAVAESEFERAAQRHAQGLYGRGMALGIAALAAICAAVALVFYLNDVPAWYGVAIVAGGVGAIVSVLQRMASQRLRLDYEAGQGTLIALGAVRPLIGATFGIVLFCAVEGDWIPAIEISTGSSLAFYAVLGFLAGFNERFAQDMLVVSAAQISKAPAPEPEGPTPTAQPTASTP